VVTAVQAGAVLKMLQELLILEVAAVQAILAQMVQTEVLVL
jgi:hypothetical protein